MREFPETPRFTVIFANDETLNVDEVYCGDDWEEVLKSVK